MAFLVRLLLVAVVAAVAALSSAVPCANTVASDEAATTEGDVTTAADAAETTVTDAATAVTEADALVTTDDPRTEPPTPPRPVAFLPAQDDSSASSSSEESSETSEDSQTDRPASTTADVGTEGGDPGEATTPTFKLADKPSEDDDEDLFADVKERYAAVPGLKLRKHRCPGVLNGRTVGGVCLDKGECLLKRGAKAGHCGLLGSCCYFQHTCGDVAHYKVSHFANPQNIPMDCQLRINVYNRDVCQIRFGNRGITAAEEELNFGDCEALGIQ